MRKFFTIFLKFHFHIQGGSKKPLVSLLKTCYLSGSRKGMMGLKIIDEIAYPIDEKERVRIFYGTRISSKSDSVTFFSFWDGFLSRIAKDSGGLLVRFLDHEVGKKNSVMRNE